MSLSNTTTSVTATGNGVTTVWPYAFKIPAAADVQVAIYDSTTMLETILSAVDYSITGLNTDVGGNVTYPLVGSPIAATKTITIRRIMPLTQDLVLTTNTAFSPATLMDQLDKIVMMIQQLDHTLDDAFIIPDGSGYTSATMLAAIVAASGYSTAAAASAVAAAASAAAAAASAGTLTPGLGTYILDTGAADVLVITPAPAIAAYADLQSFFIKKSAAANATATPTINVNAKGAKTIQKYVAGALVALVAGDMIANTEYQLMYSSGTGVMVLVNPSVPTVNFTAKATPIDADTVLIGDSTASFVGKAPTLTQFYTNYLKPKTDAAYRPKGSGRVLAFIDPTHQEFFGSTAAYLDTRNNHPCLTFVDGIVALAIATVALDGDYASASGITILIDWMASGTAVTKACFGAYVERVDLGTTDFDTDSFGAEVIDTVGVAGNATSGIASRTTIVIPSVTMDGAVAKDKIRIKIARETGQANDTDSDSVQVMGIWVMET